MCRIFGFRSVLHSKVHSSLVSAENALMGQSKRHPDGWGLAYYIAHTPHVVKSTVSAESDDLFRYLSGIVTSQTVLAHIRKATQGNLNLLNTHPFQYGRWTFAHNGNIKDFEVHKEKLKKLVDPSIVNYYLGDTDSELLFKILLSEINYKIDIHKDSPSIEAIADGIKIALEKVTAIIGSLSIRDCGIPTENYLTFVLSNGPIMLAFHGGMKLYFSTYKNKCPERDSCKSFNSSCEKKAIDQTTVNHLILSSEPLQGENIWEEFSAGEMIAVDSDMRLFRSTITLPFIL